MFSIFMASITATLFTGLHLLAGLHGHIHQQTGHGREHGTWLRSGGALKGISRCRRAPMRADTHQRLDLRAVVLNAQAASGFLTDPRSTWAVKRLAVARRRCTRDLAQT